MRSPTADGSAAWKQVLPLTGGTLSGVLNGPSFNATGSGYYQFGQLLASATNQTNGATFFGFSAGAAAIAAGNGFWLTAIGWGAGQFADGVNENTAVGGKAMNALLPGAAGNTAIGVAALMLDGTGAGNTAVGTTPCATPRARCPALASATIRWLLAHRRTAPQ